MLGAGRQDEERVGEVECAALPGELQRWKALTYQLPLKVPFNSACFSKASSTAKVTVPLVNSVCRLLRPERYSGVVYRNGVEVFRRGLRIVRE